MYLYHVFDTQIKKWECKHCRHPENMALYLGDQIRFLHLLNWGTKSSLSTIPHYFMLLWCQNMSTPEKQGFDHININKKSIWSIESHFFSKIWVLRRRRTATALLARTKNPLNPTQVGRGSLVLILWDIQYWEKIVKQGYWDSLC